MEIQQKNNHYLHTVEHPHSERSIIRPFHKYQDGHTLLIAIVNHNTIQVYKNIGCSIIYDNTYYFMCDITVMEVLPLKGNNTDILFLADELGRFMFWSPTEGVISANNLIRSNDYLAPFYQKTPAEEKQPQFSGIHFYFNTLDTEAVIFFTVATKIIILKVRWTKGKILYTSPPKEITCPYLDASFLGIIRGKEPYIGIIQQKQEKTFLRFHKINSQNFQCVSSFEKNNLASFFSGPEGQQIILVTNSQLNIFNLKNQQIFCTFQIPQSGYVCAIDSQLYLYVGQIGSQMIIFNKKHYKNYGSFMLENQVCMRLSSICRLPDDSYLVSVIDQGHTVQFIALHQQSWRSIRSIFSTSSIFNIKDLQRSNQCMAIIRVGQNMHQVGVLSKHLTSKLEKETSMKSPILGLFYINNGKAIILSNYDNNSVLIYSQQNQSFQQGFDFQLGTIIKVFDKFIVMQNKVYQMDLNQNKNKIKQILCQKTTIISADFDGKFLAYQTKDSDFKFYNTQTRECDRIRKYCFQQYIWKFHSRQILVAGILNQPGQLKIIPIFKQTSIVKLQSLQIISDIISSNDLIIISYGNCRIQIYQFVQMKIIATIDCSSEPLQLMKWNSCIIGYGNNQSYLINPLLKSYQQVQFDPSKEIVNMVYLPEYNKFLIAHPQSLALYSINRDKPDQASSFRVVSMNVDSNPPYSTVKNGRLYVAQNYQVIMRNIYTAQLLKKQSHGLKQICCIEELQIGLIVCGINDMDCSQIFIFNYEDLEIMLTDSLHKSDSLDKRTPSAIIKKTNNSFFIREDNYLTLFEIINNSLKQIFSSKIGINGYTLAIQPEISMVMASDPLRYLVVYDYRLGKLISLCRYQSLNTINDIQFLQCSVVAGDSAGNITIAQFNFDKNEAARTTMTDVASLKIGSEIIRITKGIKGVLYSTISGSVGRLKTISFEEFTALKKIEKQVLSIFEQKNCLRYEEWVNRNPSTDKLIDGFLIDYYLSNVKIRDKTYQQTEKLWHTFKEIK